MDPDVMPPSQNSLREFSLDSTPADWPEQCWEFVSQIPCVVFRLSPDGRVRYINRAITPLSGHDPCELIGLNWWAICVPREPDGELAGLAFDGDFPQTCTLMGRDGTGREVEITTRALRDDDGEIESIVGSVTEVMDRRDAEVVAEMANSLLSRVFSSMSDAVLVVSLDTHTIVMCNPAVETILGYAREDLIGSSLADLYMDPSEYLGYGRLSAGRMAAGDGSGGECDLRRADGRRVTCEMRVSRIEDDGVWRRSVVITVRDVTERKALSDLLRRYQLLGANAAETILLVSPDGRIIEANDAADEAYGYSRSELLGLRLQDLVDGGLGEEHMARMCADSGSGVTFEAVHRRKNGAGVPVEVTSRMANLEGQAILVAMVRDISERKRSEAEIVRRTAMAAALAKTATGLGNQLDLESVLSTTCVETAVALHVEGAAAAIFDEKGTVLRVVATGGDRLTGYETRAVPIPKPCLDLLLDPNGGVKVVPDVQCCEEALSWPPVSALGIRSIATAPMRRDGRVEGVLCVMSFGEPRRFDEHELSLLEGLAHLAGQAVSNTKLCDDATRRLGYLQSLRDVDRAITGSLDLGVTLDIFLGQVTTQLGVHAADILLFDQATQSLRFAKSRGFRSRALQNSSLRLGEGYAGIAARDRRLVVVPDLTTESNAMTASPLFASEGFVAYYAAPLIAKGQVQGVLELLHRTRLEPDSDWLGFLQSLVGQAAIAIDNARLFESQTRANAELVMAYDMTLEGWSKALDLRDKETEGHCLRVTELTVRLAKAMGFHSSELISIRRGALLHDIGKLGVPDSILLKPGPLTEDEWKIMRRHPIYAYEMLSQIPFLRGAIDIPYSHHEKWDGSGYPQGLKGVQIPMAARIFAVVDVWDALCSDRPYRGAWQVDRVIEHVRSRAGSHFDPDVVPCLLDLVGSHGEYRTQDRF